MRELELAQRVWSEKRDGGFRRDAILSKYFPAHQCLFSLSFSFPTKQKSNNKSYETIYIERRENIKE